MATSESPVYEELLQIGDHRNSTLIKASFVEKGYVHVCEKRLDKNLAHSRCKCV